MQYERPAVTMSQRKRGPIAANFAPPPTEPNAIPRALRHGGRMNASRKQCIDRKERA